MTKQLIAIDIDDVLADSTDMIRKLANKRHAVRLKKEHYRVAGDYWGYYERVWRQHGLDESVTIADFHEEMIASELQVPLVAGAQFAINELAKRFDIVIITSREKTWEESTKRWLSHHFADIQPAIYFARNVVDTQAKTKGEISRELGVAFLIDDSPEHCLSAIEHGIEAVLFGDYGWHHQVPPHMTRCRDWPAVLEYFNGL